MLFESLIGNVNTVQNKLTFNNDIVIGSFLLNM